MPISDCEVRDPRIRRTRQLLHASLSSLLQSRPFEEISVQDIAEAATVNRATFYDHYTDKFALLDALIAGGFHTLLAERHVQFDGTCPSAAAAVIDAACDYMRQIHERAPGHCAPCSFESLLDSAMTTAIQRVLLVGMKKYPTDPFVSAEMRAAAASWAIFGAVKEWFSATNRPQAEAIVSQILALVLPILQAPGTPPIQAHPIESALRLS